MQKILLFLLLPFMLLAGELHLRVASVNEDKDEATVKMQQIAPGVHGFVVRHFTKNNSIIIANVQVSSFNPEEGVARLKLTPYTGLAQNSLPSGNWETEVGDEVILAFAYSRALLLAPNDESYHIITKNVRGVTWIHPDNFATYLSYNAHPTPFKEDITGYCTMAEIGLLYIYINDALFTMDCQTMALIQITKAKLELKTLSLPFYSRVEEIATSWWVWGEASRPLESYDPHYFELLIEHNKNSKPLHNYIEHLSTPERDLVSKFDIEE